MSEDRAAAPPTSPRVFIATAGVFLGAGIVSLGQRLLGVGLPDLRGALGLGIDEAAWIPTAYNTALMFMGPLSVYLGALLGPRKVLLWAGAIFTLTSIALPFAPSLGVLLALQVVAGLASGTFYPLSLAVALTMLPRKYIIYGIGAYSMELLTSLSLATPLYGWLAEHLSWHWIFWTSAVLVPIMMLFIHLGIPATSPAKAAPRPNASWSGFFLFSLGVSAIYVTLEQGERLNWLDSGTVAGLLAMGTFLVVIAALRRWRAPNPLVDLSFLARRNTLILGAGLFTIRFVLLAILLLVPGYLGAVQGYRPRETGAVLVVLAGPVLLFGFIAARLMRRVDNRLFAALAFGIVASATLLDAGVTSDWAHDQFFWTQVVLAAGLAFAFVGEIGLIAQQALDSGALASPVKALTYSAFFQSVRLFGGQVGVAMLQHFIVVRSRFHTSLLGAGVQAGHYLTDERLREVAGQLAPSTPGAEELQARAVATFSGQVSRQVLTLTYMDGFILISWVCVAMMLLYACLKPIKMYFSAKELAS